MKRLTVPSPFKAKERAGAPDLRLEDGSRVAVIGGGPAGSFFSYFLLDLAQTVGLQLQVDIYEPRDFSLPGPPGCNMCAGIVSESLIQMLAMEGVNLPANVVQRGMDTYILHTDVGKARLQTPQLEKRIGAVFRGAGPLGIKDSEWRSFDGYLLEQALGKGAHLVRGRVEEVNRLEGRLQVRARGGSPVVYDLLAVSPGVNTSVLKIFQPVATGFRQPQVVQTYVREYFLGQETIERCLGEHTIHFFLLDLPGLDFAAIVPKGNYATVCILGTDLGKEVFERFLSSPQVKDCFPADWAPEGSVCHCAPRINITAAAHPFADRMVFLGDAGVSRLFKDGIGAAYRAAKYAAATAVFHGVGEEDFRRHYGRSARVMEWDNTVGKVIFAIVSQLKPRRFTIRAVVRMIAHEQAQPNDNRRMSKIIWDMFTGSSPYRDIFARCFHPAFWSRYLWFMGAALMRRVG